MTPISKPLYLGCIIGGFALSALLIVPLLLIFAEGRGRDREVAPLLMCPALLPMLLGTVMHMIVLYKMWAAIQRGAPRTTPGAAVGFLFVPFFNLYWMFQAYWGWAKDYNRYVAAGDVAAPPASEGLALTFCVLTLASIIPVIGPLFSLPNLVVLVLFLNGAINGVNAAIQPDGTTADRGPTSEGPAADRVLEFTCPTCGDVLEADPGTFGSIFDCPNCGNPVRVPDADELQEQEDKRKQLSERTAANRRRARRCLAVIIVLSLALNYLYYQALVNVLPEPDRAGRDYVRSRGGRADDNLDVTAFEFRDSSWTRRMYRQAIGHQIVSVWVMWVAIGFTSFVGVFARSRKAWLLLAWLLILVPIVAASLYLLPNSAILRPLTGDTRTTVIAVIVTHVFFSLVLGSSLLFSRLIEAATK